MSRRRFYSRHRISLAVRLRIDGGWLDCTTIDVSRAGVFLRTPTLIAEGRIVQLEITLPEGDQLTVLGKVRRTIGRMISAQSVPGIGVEFLSTSPKIRKPWDDLILDQSRRSKELAAMADEAKGGAPQRPNGAINAAGVSRSEAEKSRKKSAAKGRDREPLFIRKDLAVAFLKVRPKDEDCLREFMRRRLSQPSLTLRTDVVVEEGQRVEIALVHYKSDAELHIHGVVTDLNRNLEGGRDTITIRWRAPSQKERRELAHFAHTGTRGTASLGIEARRELTNLRRRAFLSSDAPDTWLAFAWALLDTAEAADQAAEAFLRVLNIDGDHQEALRGLALCRALQGRPAEAFGLVRAGRKLSPRVEHG